MFRCLSWTFPSREPSWRLHFTYYHFSLQFQLAFHQRCAEINWMLIGRAIPFGFRISDATLYWFGASAWHVLCCYHSLIYYQSGSLLTLWHSQQRSIATWWSYLIRTRTIWTGVYHGFTQPFQSVMTCSLPRSLCLCHHRPLSIFSLPAVFNSELLNKLRTYKADKLSTSCGVSEM